MLLLTGPPGSGKTHFVLEKLREALRAGVNAQLITPTATMAEHLRNQLAREGFVLRSSSIQTLSRFIHPLAGEQVEISPAIFQLFVREVLKAADIPEFRRVRDLPGFERAAANLLNELAAADASRKTLRGQSGRFTPESATSFKSADRQPETIACAPQPPLSVTTAFAGAEIILLDGFYNFSPPELDLIGALPSCADVIVTLPDWEGAELARQALINFGFKEERMARRRAQPKNVLITAADIEQEVEEIARRILEQAAAGREFRQIGVVVRGYAPYVPAFRTTFERFGIPARYYFPQPLSSHPAVARITRLVDASLHGWDFQQALGAVRLLPASAALDRIEFAVLNEIPTKGIDQLASITADFKSLLSDCTSITALKELSCAFPAPEVTDDVSHEDAFLWRSARGRCRSFP